MERKSQYSKREIDVTGLPEEAVQAVLSVVSLLRQCPGRVGRASKVSPEDLLGLFGDEAELLDEIVEDAMKARETQPLRLSRE